VPLPVGVIAASLLLSQRQVIGCEFPVTPVTLSQGPGIKAIQLILLFCFCDFHFTFFLHEKNSNSSVIYIISDLVVQFIGIDAQTGT